MTRVFKVQYVDKNDKSVIALSCTASMNGFKSLNEADKANALVAIKRWERYLQELKDELMPVIDI